MEIPALPPAPLLNHPTQSLHQGKLIQQTNIVHQQLLSHALASHPTEQGKEHT